MSNPGPARNSSDLADVVEMLLDKGVVINADIAVSIGDTQLLGIHLKAAVASFETAAQYGLAFPEGTDEERIAEIAGTSQQGIVGSTAPEVSGRSPDDGNGGHDDSDGTPSDEARNERTALAVRPGADRPGAGITKSDVDGEADGGHDAREEKAAESDETEGTDEADQTNAADQPDETDESDETATERDA